MERKAGISNQRADASKNRIEAGITTPAQEMQVLVDEDELPKEFLPVDATGDDLSDTEKPDKEAAEQAEGQDEEMPEKPEPEAEPKPDETPAKAETKARTKEEASHRLHAVISGAGNRTNYSCTLHHIGGMTMDEAERHFTETHNNADPVFYDTQKKALQEIGELIAQEQDEAQDLYRKAIGEE